MSQGSIAMPQPQTAKSPLEGILHALQAVHAVYGINTEAAQQKLLESKTVQQGQENQLGQEKLNTLAEEKDAGSQKSQLARASHTALLDDLQARGQNVSALRSMIQSQGDKPLSADDLKGFNENPQVKLAIADAAAKAATLRQANAFTFRDGNIDKHQSFQENKLALGIANKDPEIVTVQNRLNGLVRIQDIIKKVEKGEIKGTTQIKNSIANEYAKLESGTNSAGLGQSERATMVNTLRSDANDLITRVFGTINPDGSISPDQLKQLKAEIGTMGHSYQEQFDQRHDALRDGFMYPESQKTVDTKLGSIRNSFTKRMGGWRTGGASEGQGAKASPVTPIEPHPQDQQAVDWAKANPTDKRSALILKANGVGQ